MSSSRVRNEGLSLQFWTKKKYWSKIEASKAVKLNVYNIEINPLSRKYSRSRKKEKIVIIILFSVSKTKTPSSLCSRGR